MVAKLTSKGLILDDRFDLMSNLNNRIFVFQGKKLTIQISDLGVKIKKQGISCPLIHTTQYSMYELDQLIIGLQLIDE